MTARAGSPSPEPLDWRPGRLLSLWDIMREFQIGRVLDSYNLVLRLWGRIENKREVWDNIARDDHGTDFPEIKAEIKRLAERLLEVQLTIPHEWTLKLYELAEKGATYRLLMKEIEFVHRIIVSHFRERMVLIIDPHMTRYFESKAPLFGETVHSKFAPTRLDISEAGTCFALSRWAASVFHSVRAGEYALHSVRQSLRVPLRDKGNQQTWGWIVHDIGEDIKQRKKQKPPCWLKPQDEDMFEAFYGSLDAISKAYRDPAVHGTTPYLEWEARYIFEVINGFMRKVAEQIDASGEPKQPALPPSPPGS